MEKNTYRPVPVPVIVAAVQGDGEAIRAVIERYERYIIFLSGKCGYPPDKDVEERLKSRLMIVLSKFRVG